MEDRGAARMRDSPSTLPRWPGRTEGVGSGVAPAAAFVVLAAGVLTLDGLGPDRSVVAVAMLPWTVAFGALLLLVRRHATWVSGGSRLLLGALLLRIPFLLPVGAPPPDLSDDLFRYVWDGWLGVTGIPPFRFRPDDPTLELLRDPVLFPALNSPSYHSVYPPLSQAVFRLGGIVHAWAGWPASGWTIRVAMTALELGGIGFLVAAVRRAGWGPRGQAALALHAWNPLAIVAVAGSGHSEGGLVFALGLLALGVASRVPTLAWLGWVLAVLSKGIPLLLAPLVWRATSGSGSRWRPLILPGMVGLLLTLPFFPLAHLAGDLARAWSSVELYARHFEFNAGIHALLRHGLALLPWVEDAGWVGPWLRGVAVAGALFLTVGMRQPAGDLAAFARGTLAVLSLYLVTATTLHPWYLLWGLPFVALTAGSPGSQGFVAPWLWMTWASFATYLVYVGVPAPPLAFLFWGGALAIALLLLLDTPPWQREGWLRPLRKVAALRKAGWLRPWIQGSTLADLGGGEGDVARNLVSDRETRVLLLDPDPGDRARPRPPSPSPDASSPGWPGLLRVRARAEALPLREGSVDTVVLSFVLHHLADPDQGLREALRVARQRVLVLESVYRTEGGRRVLARLDRWVNARRGGGTMGAMDAPLQHRRAEAWVRAVAAAGGRVVHAAPPPGRLRWLFPHQVLILVIEPGDAAMALPPGRSDGETGA